MIKDFDLNKEGLANLKVIIEKNSLNDKIIVWGVNQRGDKFLSEVENCGL